MFNAKVVAGLSGLPHHAIRQMSHRGIMRPQGPKKTWTKNQTLGLCAMRHARLAGASMSAAVGAYEILSRANWDALRAACAVGKHYLRIFGETVEMQTVTHRAAFAQKIIQAATQQQTPYCVVDVGHWLNRIDLAEREMMADVPLQEREKMPA